MRWYSDLKGKNVYYKIRGLIVDLIANGLHFRVVMPIERIIGKGINENKLFAWKVKYGGHLKG